MVSNTSRRKREESEREETETSSRKEMRSGAKEEKVSRWIRRKREEKKLVIKAETAFFPLGICTVREIRSLPGRTISFRLKIPTRIPF